MVDDFERMWSDLAPIGRSAASAATSASRSPSPSASSPTGSASRPPPAASPSRPTTPATCVAGGSPARRTVPGPRRRPHRVAPRLGAGRRGVRRAAGGGLGAGGARRAARARRRADPADRGVGVRGGGGVAVRAGLPRVPAGDRRDRLGAGAGRCATATASPSRRSSRVAGRGCWTASAPSWSCTSSRAATSSTAARRSGVASEIWPHGRYRFDFEGEANHAGSTRMEDRADPMLTYAMTALAANKQARLAGQRATFGRVEVTPNGTNAVPSRVLAWLDARCSSDAALSRAGGDGHPAGRRARRAGRHHGRRSPPSRCRGRSPSTPGWRGGSPPTTRAATGRSSRPRPATTPESLLHKGSRPPCCSSATPPASRTRRPRRASVPDCLAGVHALAETLERLAT